MIVEKELRKLLHQLVKEDLAHIMLGDSDVLVHTFDNNTKISLSTSVYFGGNYIPLGVRKCLSSSPAFEHGHLKTTFAINEESFQITLSYLGGLAHLNKRMFIDLLEEFSWLGDEWRKYLDEHDKNDLIYVRNKPT